MVVRIQDRCDSSGAVGRLDSTFIVSGCMTGLSKEDANPSVQEITIERIQIKASLRLTLPKPQVIRRRCSVPWNHHIIGDCEDLLTPLPDRPSGPIAKSLSVSVEANIVCNVKTWKLPWILII